MHTIVSKTLRYAGFCLSMGAAGRLDDYSVSGIVSSAEPGWAGCMRDFVMHNQYSSFFGHTL